MVADPSGRVELDIGSNPEAAPYRITRVTVKMCAVAATASLALFAGCSSTGVTASGEPADTHTMSDGTVMEGSRHVHDDSHDHGGSEATEEVGPSKAARMVCTGQVVDDVTRIMGLDDTAAPSSQWQEPVFTCTFDLPAGPLVLTVHDAEDVDVGRDHFRAQRASRTNAEPIKGVYSLGLPAYETAAGVVSFVRDGKTLEVDATGLSGGPFGVHQDMDRAGVAYAVATSVLACWTQHD